MKSVYMSDIDIMYRQIEEYNETSKIILNTDIEALKTCPPKKIMDLVAPSEDLLVKTRFMFEEL